MSQFGTDVLKGKYFQEVETHAVSTRGVKADVLRAATLAAAAAAAPSTMRQNSASTL